MATSGKGQYGCHFYLHRPETQQILANTPYYLAVYPASAKGRTRNEPLVVLTGVTDARGRSGYVRADFPIIPEQVQFVEMIGSGQIGQTPRLIRPTDGAVMPGMRYLIKWCGKEYTGITDEQGNAPRLSSNEPCQFEVRFFAKK